MIRGGGIAAWRLVLDSTKRELVPSLAEYRLLPLTLATALVLCALSTRSRHERRTVNRVGMLRIVRRVAFDGMSSPPSGTESMRFFSLFNAQYSAPTVEPVRSSTILTSIEMHHRVPRHAAQLLSPPRREITLKKRHAKPPPSPNTQLHRPATTAPHNTTHHHLHSSSTNNNNAPPNPLPPPPLRRAPGRAPRGRRRGRDRRGGSRG